MAEQTREFRIDVRVYRDTNKATYDETESFETYDEALTWLREQVAGDDEKVPEPYAAAERIATALAPHRPAIIDSRADRAPSGWWAVEGSDLDGPALVSADDLAAVLDAVRSRDALVEQRDRALSIATRATDAIENITIDEAQGNPYLYFDTPYDNDHERARLDALRCEIEGGAR